MFDTKELEFYKQKHDEVRNNIKNIEDCDEAPASEEDIKEILSEKFGKNIGELLYECMEFVATSYLVAKK